MFPENLTFIWSVPVARSHAHPTSIQEVVVQSSGLATFFVEIGHEIISKAVLSLPLIQIGQLSVTGEMMCTIEVLVKHLGLSLPKKSVVRSTFFS